jgi:glycerol-3-phosphate dehydrogenase
MNAKSREARLKKCEGEQFDMVVIGGGIAGSGVARDASLRGLKCLLLEKGDFSSGTSSKSSKLVHGGLRYLRYYNFGLVFEGCRERYRLLKKIAPHIVEAKRFVYPFYRGDKTPRWLVAIGLFAYSLLALFRNIHLFRFIPLKKLFKEEPALRREDCVGALSFYDCRCLDFRLVIDTVKSAAESGAMPFNYCEVLKMDFADNQVKVRAVDRLAEKEYLFTARMALNAGGAWADDILEGCGESEKFNLKTATGIHLIFDNKKLPVKNTLLVEAPLDGRAIFFIPWGQHILVGTTDKYFDGDKDKIPVRPDSIDYLLETVNHFFPAADLTRSDVRSVYAGVRSLISDASGKSEEEMPRDDVVLIDKRGIVSITGGKLTTYRAMAEKAVDAAITGFFPDRKLKPCKTVSAISGGDMKEVRRIKGGRYGSIRTEEVETLCGRYGSNASTVLDYCEADPASRGFINQEVPYIRAELKYFVENEFCEKLVDVMFRRSDIYLFGRDNGLAVAHDIAEYVGKLKGWDEKRIKEEVDQYREWVGFLFKDLKP